jgi:hypothetical protein
MTRSGYCSSSQKTDFELPMGVLWLIGMASYADTAIACQDPKHSAPLFDRLAPYSDQVATTGLAVAFNDRAHAKFFAARTNLEWAKMLAARNGPGDTEHARDAQRSVPQGGSASHPLPRRTGGVEGSLPRRHRAPTQPVEPDRQDQRLEDHPQRIDHPSTTATGSRPPTDHHRHARYTSDRTVPPKVHVLGALGPSVGESWPWGCLRGR